MCVVVLYLAISERREVYVRERWKGGVASPNAPTVPCHPNHHILCLGFWVRVTQISHRFGPIQMFSGLPEPTTPAQRMPAHGNTRQRTRKARQRTPTHAKARKHTPRHTTPMPMPTPTPPYATRTHARHACMPRTHASLGFTGPEIPNLFKA